MNGIAHGSFTQYHSKDLYVLHEQCLPLFKIAVMHAQFESIHPFWDGNGRTGRILISLMALKYGLVEAPIFFISEALERQKITYYRALNAVRGDDPHWGEWLRLFVSAARSTAEDQNAKIKQASALYKAGLDSCSKESERRVWTATFAQLVITSAQAADLAGVSIGTARCALKKLVEKKLLSTKSQSGPNRTFFNHALCNILQGAGK